MIFGHPKNIVLNRLKLFDFLQKKLKVKIVKKSDFVYYFEYGTKSFEVRFCYNPRMDEASFSSKRYIKKHFKENTPLSARELIGKIKSNTVIFFGTCGSLKGNLKRGDILLPVTTRSIYFRGGNITKDQLSETKPTKPIKIKNFLFRKIKAYVVNDVTTNIIAFPSNLKGLKKDEYVDFVKKYGDVIQKELYEIANHVKVGTKIGAILICSDTPSQKLSPKSNFNFKKPYQNTLLEVIRKTATLAGA